MRWESNMQISPHLPRAPVTPADDNVSGDEDMEIPSSSLTNIQLMYLYIVIVQNFRRWMMIQWLLQRARLPEQMVMCVKWRSRPRGAVGIAALLCRWQTAGGGSIPRWSASKTQDRRPAERQRARTKKNVRQVAEDEVCHSDEPEVMVDDWEDSLQFPDSEDEYISNQAEGEGPPQVSSEKLRELDEQAALDELEKMHNMEVIQPVVSTLPWYYPGIWLAFQRQQLDSQMSCCCQGISNNKYRRKHFFSKFGFLCSQNATYICSHVWPCSDLSWHQRCLLDGAPGGSDVCWDYSMGVWTYRKARDTLATSKVLARTAQCSAQMASTLCKDLWSRRA